MNKTDFIFIILGITFSLTCERRIDPEIIATVGSTFVTQDDFIVAYSKKLPSFMYPSDIFLFKDDFPRTQNGKVDKKELNNLFLKNIQIN